MRANADEGTSTSIAADTVAPSRMNGIASTSSEPKTISRLRSHGTLEGSVIRTRTATPTRAASTQITWEDGRSRRRLTGPWRSCGDVDRHQQYLAKATANDGDTSANS